jgi:hypothetical protein
MEKIMNNIRISLSTTMLLAVVAMGLSFNTCWADFNLRLLNGYRQQRIDFQVEDLDNHHCHTTGYTSNWNAVKNLRTYQLGSYATWYDKCSHTYAQLRGQYGFIVGGKVVGYPLHWDLDGHTTNLEAEVGYIITISDCFDFVPLIGYSYGTVHYKLHRQHFGHSSPFYFADRNGNKTDIRSYSPYIGFDMHFDHCFCERYKFNFCLGYDFFYGNTNFRTRASEFVLTDDPNTSNYGYHSRGRNQIGHEFKLESRYVFCNQWEVGLRLTYDVSYNTHRENLKLQHDHDIADSGQYRHSQYHVVNELCFHSYEVDFHIAYNF